MNKSTANVIGACIIFLIGILAGTLLPQDRSCTVTITDFHGTKHVITGVADDE